MPGRMILVSPQGGGLIVPGGGGGSLVGGSPQLSHYSISGPQSYDNPGVIAKAALCQISIFGTWNGWQSGKSLTLRQICDQIHAASTVNSKVALYMLPIDQLDPPSSAWTSYWNNLNTGFWWVYSSYHAGTKSPGASGFISANVTAGGNTIGGRSYQQYASDFSYDYMVNGGAFGLSVNGTDAVNPSLDALYQDNLKGVMPVGDWNRSGVTSGSLTALQAGQLAVMQRFQARKAGLLIGGNVSGFQLVGSDSTGFDGQLDFGVLEAMLGESNSYETFLTNPLSEFLRIYSRQMAILNATGLGVFVHSKVAANGTDPYDATPYRAQRHGLCACLAAGDATYAAQGLTSYNPILSAALWFDEYSVNTVTQLPYTSPNATAAPGLGYLGTAIDPPQTTAWQGTVFRREYQNGYVYWNPKGGTAATINFGGTQRFINGAQAPTINRGGSGTTAAMAVRDGLITLK